MRAGSVLGQGDGDDIALDGIAHSSARGEVNDARTFSRLVPLPCDSGRDTLLVILGDDGIKRLAVLVGGEPLHSWLRWCRWG